MRIRDTRDVGNIVRDRRNELGWTLDDLAERIPMSRRWLADVESGKSGVALGPVLSLLYVLGLGADVQPRDTQAEAFLDNYLTTFRVDTQ